MQSLGKISPAFGQSFYDFGQAWAILLDKLALVQTGLGNFALAQILKGTLHVAHDFPNNYNYYSNL